MERLESAVWPLAAGVLCAFALAVVLKGVAWEVGFAAVMACVAGWSLAASPLVGVVLGLSAWAFVTGFDVNRSGDLVIPGDGDAARAVALVAVGLAAGAAGRWLAGRPAPDTDDPPAPEETLVPHLVRHPETRAHVVPLQRHPRPVRDRTLPRTFDRGNRP